MAVSGMGPEQRGGWAAEFFKRGGLERGQDGRLKLTEDRQELIKKAPSLDSKLMIFRLNDTVGTVGSQEEREGAQQATEARLEELGLRRTPTRIS